MSALLVLLGLCPDPPAADLDHFPGYWVAQTQLCACAEHRARLLRLRAVRGWEGGAWDRALADLDHAETYWLWLALAHRAPEPACRGALARLRDHAGHARYLRGWAPPLCPGADRFDPPWGPSRKHDPCPANPLP